ncbi:Rossmann-fold NAD(P)-binding domain-containing protein [Parafrankia discariae]|uniref:UDP-glucose/GDP-mannose dehydrogenase family protein n=1 Tax=Parafrankia discariae TaxID=365528 RepID=UPI00039A79F4|nr:UDP-glucose/GDP-mannose dehydrogenase family protein [Parafrankia discariae]
MRIFVVGSGVVGTATGRGLLDAGHRVTFIDVSPERIAFLNEIGLDARPEIDLRSEGDSVVFLTLPTPNAGSRYDLTAFVAGIRGLGRALRETSAVHTVVVRSTVDPGTTEGLVGPLLEQESGLRQGSGFLLASNPEFLRASSAAEDFRWPWMTVVGARNRRVQERLAELFAPFGGTMRIFDDPMTAEFVKCAHNIFNATKISFWNEMHVVAERLHLDLGAVAETVARSAEASFNPAYGTRGGAPYGGVCLPKDTMAFLGFAAGVGVDMPILRSVIEMNSRFVDRAAGGAVTGERAGAVDSLGDRSGNGFGDGTGERVGDGFSAGVGDGFGAGAGAGAAGRGPGLAAARALWSPDRLPRQPRDSRGVEATEGAPR